MDVSRFSGARDAREPTTHQRIAEYVKPLCERYVGAEFTPRVEWIVEQTLAALQILLDDVRCTEAERQAVQEFLSLATESLPGPP